MLAWRYRLSFTGVAMKTYRQGAVGALMDEYERVVAELEGILEEISDADFELVRDTETRDENCRSIQTILTHVVGAGYGYAGMMRDAWGMERVGRMYEPMTRSEAPGRLAAMLEYTRATLEGHWDLSEDEANAMKMQSGWGQLYDFEQLFEHAIVHVMRHRRQIERFLKR
jgi:uncharacterized damage-inducible protein DinB